MKATYYQILTVTHTASAEEIKIAYRKQCSKYHPDRNKSPHATLFTQVVNEAYTCLLDVHKRREYDMKLRLTTNQSKPEPKPAQKQPNYYHEKPKSADWDKYRYENEKYRDFIYDEYERKQNNNYDFGFDGFDDLDHRDADKDYNDIVEKLRKAKKRESDLIDELLESIKRSGRY